MQKLVVHNFRQMSDASIEVSNFLVLIGEQASGKSTLAKLIYFFKSFQQDFVEVLYNDDSEHFYALILNRIRDKFYQYFGTTERLSDDFLIRYYYNAEANEYVEFSKRNKLNVQFENKFWKRIGDETHNALDQIWRVRVPDSIDNFKLQEMNKKAVLIKLQDLSRELFSNDGECLFFPAGRSITVSYPEQFQLLFYGGLDKQSFKFRKPVVFRDEPNTIDLQLMKEFVGYSKILVDHFASKDGFVNQNSQLGFLIAKKIGGILHGSYQNEDGKERIFFTNEDNAQYVPLSIASSGQQECIRIIQDFVLSFSRNVNFSRIIEEPETHLYPTAQKLLVDLMALVANKTNGQVILTTHSPYILSAFNNLLYYNKTLRERPELQSDLDKHFGTCDLNRNEKERLDVCPDCFRAYALKPGAEQYCKSIFDDETKLIGNNYIDEASEKIYEDFDFLYNLI